MNPPGNGNIVAPHASEDNHGHRKLAGKARGEAREESLPLPSLPLLHSSEMASTHSPQSKRMATEPKEHPTTDRRQLSLSDTPGFQTPGLFPDPHHPPFPSSTAPASDDYSGTRHEDLHSEDPNYSTTSSTAYEISPSLPSTSAPSLSSSTRPPDTTSTNVSSSDSQRRNSTSSYLSDITDPTSSGHPPSTTHATLSSIRPALVSWFSAL